jgi:hypothetical protein
MKPLAIVLTTIIVTVSLTSSAIYFIVIPRLYPLNNLFQETSVNIVNTEKRTLGAVVTDVVKQVEAKSGKKIRLIFAPESLANNTIEKDGGVSGNPPVKGIAVDALHIACMDFRCSFQFVDDNTVLFYKAEDD